MIRNEKYKGGWNVGKNIELVWDEDLCNEFERRERKKASCALNHFTKDAIKAEINKRGLVRGRDW